jgi:hypothetical protein
MIHTDSRIILESLKIGKKENISQKKSERRLQHWRGKTEHTRRIHTDKSACRAL